MLLWFKDLMDVTEKLLEEALDRIVETLGLWIVTSRNIHQIFKPV